MSNGGSGEGFMEIMLEFKQKLIKNPQWSRNYRTEINDLNTVLNNTKIDNRFAGADTSNMAAFLEDMNSKFQNTSFENKNFLTRNIEYFALVLGKKI